MPPSRPLTAPLSPRFLISLPTCLVSSSRMTFELVLESWLDALTGAEGLVNARAEVEALGRAAARRRAGRRRNMVCYSSWVGKQCSWV